MTAGAASRLSSRDRNSPGPGQLPAGATREQRYAAVQRG